MNLLNLYAKAERRASCSLDDLCRRVPAAQTGLARPFAKQQGIAEILTRFCEIYVSAPNARACVHSSIPLHAAGAYVALTLPEGLVDEEIFWHEIGHVIEALSAPFLHSSLPEAVSEAFASWFALYAMGQEPERLSAEAVVAALYAGLDNDPGSVLWALGETFAANGDTLAWKALNAPNV
jgi:hypothetical protein